MRITGKGIWKEPQDRGEAIRVLRRAIELGVNFIDTADSYGPEVSPLERAAEAYEHMMSGKARFRAVLTTGRRASAESGALWRSPLVTSVVSQKSFRNSKRWQLLKSHSNPPLSPFFKGRIFPVAL
jgi:aryl-alcohol dehydrogenase-like predicted oxidoreductase